MRVGLGKGKRIVVIGGSAAGAAAAARAKRLYPNADVFILEEGPYVSYGSCELPFYLNGEIDSIEKLQLFTPQNLATEKNIDVYIRTKVLEIDRRKQILILSDDSGKRDFPYDKLIVSTGSRARTLLSSFGDYSNVFSLKNLPDGKKIRDFIYQNQPRKLIILGAGYIALEILEALKVFGLEVNILNVEDLPLPGFSLEARRVSKEILHKSGVSYSNYKEISDCSSNDGKLNSVLADGRWYEGDFFIEAMGVIPNSQIAHRAGIIVAPDLTIAVDKKMKTSSGNIFAAGDVTHGFHFLTGKPYFFPLAQMANSMARIAASNLFSATKNIYSTLGTSGLSFAGLDWAKTGFSFLEAQSAFGNMDEISFSTWNKPEVMSDAGKIYWNIVIQKNSKKIFGATLWGARGAADKINTINLAIRSGISSIDLADSDFLYSPRFSPQLDGFQILGRLIEK